MQSWKCCLSFPVWLSLTHPTAIRKILSWSSGSGSSPGCYRADLIHRSHCWVWSQGNPGNWWQNEWLCSILGGFTISQHLKSEHKDRLIHVYPRTGWSVSIRGQADPCMCLYLLEGSWGRFLKHDHIYLNHAGFLLDSVQVPGVLAWVSHMSHRKQFMCGDFHNNENSLLLSN